MGNPVEEKVAEQVRQDPAVAMRRWFAYDHLPEHLQAVSRPFGELFEDILAMAPPSAERTVGVRKLLEAKDCVVRAALPR